MILCMGSRASQLSFSGVLSALVFESVPLSLGLRTYSWARLASQQAPGSLSLLPKYWITSMHCHSDFLCGCWRGYLGPHALVEIKWRTQRWDFLGRSFHFYLRTLLKLDTLSAESVTCLGILLF